MATISLDSIREAADRKYGATDVDLGTEKVRLVNVLRLPKERREALVAAQNQLKDEDADQEGILKDCILLVAEDRAAGERLVEAVGDDLAVLVEVFSEYTSGTELGEASASQS